MDTMAAEDIMAAEGIPILELTALITIPIIKTRRAVRTIALIIILSIRM